MERVYSTYLKCCGCETCANVCPKSAITMSKDAYGFRYPLIDKDKCVDCGICLKKCDFQKENGKGVGTHEPIEAYAAYYKDETILMKSVSGGVFTAFAEYVIAKGGCVYGCIMDDEFNVRIVRGDAIEDIEPMRGSKYIQADMGDIYYDVKAQLANGRLVLFTGTPCQVAALSSYLGNGLADNLITIDLICHGVPSVKSLKLYVSFLEQYKDIKVKQYKFRSKEVGWGLKGAVEITSEKKGKLIKKIIYSKNDFWKSNFSSWNSIRPSCTSCKYANFSRTGDFTMGDYWGWKKLGMDLPTSKGLSVLLVNTFKWAHMIPHLNMVLVKTPIEIARQGNETFNHSAKKGRYWNEFMNCVADNNFLPFYLGFEKFKKDRQRKEKKEWIKSKIRIPFKIAKRIVKQLFK